MYLQWAGELEAQIQSLDGWTERKLGRLSTVPCQHTSNKCLSLIKVCFPTERMVQTSSFLSP